MACGDKLLDRSYTMWYSENAKTCKASNEPGV